MPSALRTTDTSEKGLETLIMLHLTGVDGLSPAPESAVAETPDATSAASAMSGHLDASPRARIACCDRATVSFAGIIASARRDSGVIIAI